MQCGSFAGLVEFDMAFFFFARKFDMALCRVIKQLAAATSLASSSKIFDVSCLESVFPLHYLNLR